MASNPGIGSPNNTIVNNSSGSGSQYYYDQSAKFNPTTAVVIISLIGGCFLLAFVSVVVRKWLQGEPGLTTTQSSATQSGSYNSKSKGLEKADVDALPLVHREDLDEKGERECPVCLTEFEPEDMLRLLPTCKHVFHQECIDAWFDAHSTCPLCRASLLGQPVVGVKNNSAAGELQHVAPVGTITEVSESGVETRQPRSDVPLDDSRTANAAVPPLGAPISREEEPSSARGRLFWNSGSFKRAAAVTAGDQQSTKNSKPPAGPTSPSIRRSSSLSADLIALRNLLMGQNDQNADSSRWFARARSLEVAPRDRAEANARDEWVTIDLETGKAATDTDPSSSSSLSSAPERTRSDRWSLASLKGALIFPLSRSTSDVSSRAAHLPV